MRVNLYYIDIYSRVVEITQNYFIRKFLHSVQNYFLKWNIFQIEQLSYRTLNIETRIQIKMYYSGSTHQEKFGSDTTFQLYRVQVHQNIGWEQFIGSRSGQKYVNMIFDHFDWCKRLAIKQSNKLDACFKFSESILIRLNIWTKLLSIFVYFDWCMLSAIK